MTFGIVDIATLLLVTVGPLKALIVFATLTARADARLPPPGRDPNGHGRDHRDPGVRGRRQLLPADLTISLPALKIAGGIILLLVALDMVMGGSHEDEIEKPKALSPDIAVFPLAMPMMATPQGLRRDLGESDFVSSLFSTSSGEARFVRR